MKRLRSFLGLLGAAFMMTPAAANPVKLDDSEWHVEGEFPRDLPASAGSIHIRAFLTWAIKRELVTQDFAGRYPDLVRRAKEAGTVSDVDLGACCDGKLLSSDLAEGATAFAIAYYGKTPAPYLDDYTALTANFPTTYHAPDDASWFTEVAQVIDKRLERWKRTGRIE